MKRTGKGIVTPERRVAVLARRLGEISDAGGLLDDTIMNDVIDPLEKLKNRLNGEAKPELTKQMDTLHSRAVGIIAGGALLLS